MSLTAQEFRERAAQRRKVVVEDIDGLGAVRLRALSAGDAQRFQSEVGKLAAKGEDAESLAFTLIARSWIDDAGELLFPEAEGIAVAQSLDPADYNRLAKAVLKLNGLSDDAVEDAEKNSVASRGASTPTGSPETWATPTSI